MRAFIISLAALFLGAVAAPVGAAPAWTTRSADGATHTGALAIDVRNDTVLRYVPGQAKPTRLLLLKVPERPKKRERWRAEGVRVDGDGHVVFGSVQRRGKDSGLRFEVRRQRYKAVTWLIRKGVRVRQAGLMHADGTHRVRVVIGKSRKSRPVRFLPVLFDPQTGEAWLPRQVHEQGHQWRVEGIIHRDGKPTGASFTVLW